MARRVHRRSGGPPCDSGPMAAPAPRASLPARLRATGWTAGQFALAWAVAAVVAVSLAGLVGLGVAVVVVSTPDPTGGLSVGGSIGLAGRLWLLASGAELELPSGPLRLAPLLLTLGIAWGLFRAGRFAVHGRGNVGAYRAAGTTAALVTVHAV